MIFNRNNPNGNVSLTIIGAEEPVPGTTQDPRLNLLSMLAPLDPMEQLHKALASQLMEVPEAVNHPEHYRKGSGLEAIDVIEAWNLNFNLGNVIKYVCRAGLKSEGREEDINKALWYLKRELNQED